LLDKPKLAKKYPELIKAQKEPLALIETAMILGASPLITAMIDLSDGLMKDALNLGKAAKLCVHLDCSKIPITPSVFAAAADLGLNPMKMALEGGEDYGLWLRLLPMLATKI
jgi:thiamine-monophosphate kinase